MFDDETVMHFTALDVIHNERVSWDKTSNGDQVLR
jgi:hypothetical protein